MNTKLFSTKSLLSLGVAAALAGCGGGSSGGSGSANSSPSPDSTSAEIVLSGTIDIEYGARVDADDAGTLASGRKVKEGLQYLPEEFVLAGYVSADPATDSSASTETVYPEDEADSYRVSLVPGQTVVLQALNSHGAKAPLKLTLFYGTGSQRIEAFTGESADSAASVTLPATEPAGYYLVEIEPEEAGPTLYVLSSKVGTTSLASSLHWPDNDFVEGEALVAFNNTSAMMQTASVRASSASSASAMEPVREVAPGIWQVRKPALQAFARQASVGTGAEENATLEWISQLRDDPSVASAVPNYRMKSMALWGTPASEPEYARQWWHYNLLHAAEAWQLAPKAGDGVTVAVLDTGLFGSPGNWHSDLDPNVVIPSGQILDYVSESYDNDSQPGRDTNPSDPGNLLGDGWYHGTHVAGTIAAAVNNTGGGGIAYKASLLPVRVLGEGGSGSASDLLAALNWVVGSGSSSPRADVVNMSLGGLPYIKDLETVIKRGVDKGMVFVAAAGNAATTEPSYPAAFDEVLAVSAVDAGGKLASYSNHGDWIDLAAPGGDGSRDGNGDGAADWIYSSSAITILGNTTERFRGLQGTSMATPHVAGVIALMKSVNPDVNFGKIRNWLQAGSLTQAPCTPDPCVHNQELGWGIMDAAAAVLAASNAMVPEILVASPTTVNLSSATGLSETVDLSVYGAEGSSVQVLSVTESADWLSVKSDPPVPGSGSLFRLTMTLDPDKLDPGFPARTSVVVSYTSDQQRTLEIPVVGQTLVDQGSRDAGRHYVILIEPDLENGGFKPVAQTVANAENGKYQFSIPLDGVEPGNYQLIAGTDLDNDGYLCHAGESCAEFPVNGFRQDITITGTSSVKGLHMTTSYTRPAITQASADLLPRPDFSGYPLLSTADSENEQMKGVAQ